MLERISIDGVEPPATLLAFLALPIVAEPAPDAPEPALEPPRILTA
jgi:hypothetical protein